MSPKSSSLILKGQAYCLGHPEIVEISTGKTGQGILFQVGEQKISYSLDTLFPHQKLGARMNMVIDTVAEKSFRILVPEHLISLVVMLSLQAGGGFRPDVTICLPVPRRGKEVFVPVLGPGISCDNFQNLGDLIQLACGSREKILKVNQYSQTHFSLQESIAHQQIIRTGTLVSETSCLATLLSNVQSDIVATHTQNSKQVTLDFANPNLQYASARAMGRLSSRPVYRGVRGAHALGLFHGITSDNYFLVGPKSTEESIRASMHNIYQDGFNEHLWHSLYADLPGELAARATSAQVDRFHLHLIMGNMRHQDRLDWFKNICYKTQENGRDLSSLTH